MIHASPRLIGSILGALFVSCSAARPAVVPAEEELSQQILFLEESLDGQVTAHWVRAESVDLSRYRLPSRAQSTYGRIVRVMNYQRDCDAENRACINDCMRRRLARGYGHITLPERKRGAKEAFCVHQCAQPYRDCVDLQRLRPQEFSTAENAVAWLKENREALFVGSSIVVAGVVLVTVSVGVGLIVLVPATLLVY